MGPVTSRHVDDCAIINHTRTRRVLCPADLLLTPRFLLTFGR